MPALSPLHAQLLSACSPRKISTGSMYEDNIRKTSTAVMYDATTTNCSHESLVFAIERFFKSVNTMNSIVMVPSKLVDIDDDSDQEGSVDMSSTASVCSDSDDSVTPQRSLYHAYKMLVDAKEDLVWTREDAEIPVPELPQAKQFKYHLEQLTHLLADFSGLADHLTVKYQNAPGIREEEL